MAEVEIEEWTKEEMAEFILNDSLSEAEYRRNLVDVLGMGLDPTTLDSAYLVRDEPWQCAEDYQDLRHIFVTPSLNAGCMAF